MTFGQTEIILLVAFIILWWLFYFTVKLRAHHKYIKSGEKEDMRPCHGCVITQSAMLAATTLAIAYGSYLMGWVDFIPL